MAGLHGGGSAVGPVLAHRDHPQAARTQLSGLERRVGQQRRTTVPLDPAVLAAEHPPLREQPSQGRAVVDVELARIHHVRHGAR